MFVWLLKSSNREGKWMMKKRGWFVKVRSGLWEQETGEYWRTDIKRL